MNALWELLAHFKNDFLQRSGRGDSCPVVYLFLPVSSLSGILS